ASSCRVAFALPGCMPATSICWAPFSVSCDAFALSASLRGPARNLFVPATGGLSQAGQWTGLDRRAGTRAQSVLRRPVCIYQPSPRQDQMSTVGRQRLRALLQGAGRRTLQVAEALG